MSEEKRGLLQQLLRRPLRWLPFALLPVVLLCAPPILAIGAPQDVEIPQVKPRKAPPAAMFSHWSHNQLQCYSCHPSIFPQAREGFTHAEMREGRYCGACHDGVAARSISATKCEDCHVAR